MYIDTADIHPSSPLEESLVELHRAGRFAQLRLYHYLHTPGEAERHDLDRALDQYDTAARSVRAAITARETVDRGLPRIAEAVRKHRAEEHPSEEEIHP